MRPEAGDEAYVYGEIRHERIWAVCVERLPGLVRRLNALGIGRDPGADIR
jgi:hypothetical protein